MDAPKTDPSSPNARSARPGLGSVEAQNHVPVEPAELIMIVGATDSPLPRGGGRITSPAFADSLHYERGR